MDVFYSIRENAAKIMIALGIVFLVLGVLTLTTLFTVIPMFSLFLGFLLLALGFFAHVGLFSVEWRSPNGLAMILLCVSVAFFALAVASIQFQEISSVRVAHQRFDVVGNFPAGRTFEDWLIVNTDRPFMSLFVLATQVGLASFLVSLAVKAYSRMRSIL